MNNQDELNFRRFEEIYPVYRDMGRKVKAEFQKAKEIDLFNTKEIQSQAKEIEGLRTAIKGMVACSDLWRIPNDIEYNDLSAGEGEVLEKMYLQLKQLLSQGTTQPDSTELNKPLKGKS